MTAPMTMTNCPTDPNLLAAFADGRLEGDERQRVVEHLSTCPECYDEVEMAQTYAQESGGEVLTPRRGWLGPAVTLAAAAAIAGAFFLTPIGDRIMRPRRIAALQEATTKLHERPIAGRPSFDIPYKDRTRLRGGGESNADLRVASVAVPLVKAADKHPTVENLQAAGVAWLLMKEPAEALVSLEKALKVQTGGADVTASNNARLLNDLAVAYYESHKYEQAKVAIERAWQLEKSAPIAWTRATILESADGWKDYLAIDSTSQWADDARRSLETYTGN